MNPEESIENQIKVLKKKVISKGLVLVCLFVGLFIFLKTVPIYCITYESYVDVEESYGIVNDYNVTYSKECFYSVKERKEKINEVELQNKIIRDKMNPYIKSLSFS